MGFFKGLKDAQTFDRGTPFKSEGLYRLKLKKAISKETQQKGPAFIVEFEVLRSSTPETDPVGATRSWFQKLTDKNVGFGAVKEFMYAVEGLDKQKDKAQIAKFDAEIEELMDEVTEKNVLAGVVIDLQTDKVTTKKGEPFTRHTWKHVPEEEQKASA